MKNLFLAELKKVIKSSLFIPFLVCVLVLNAYILISTAENSYAKPVEYRQIFSSMDSMTDEECLEWLGEMTGSSTQIQPYTWKMIFELLSECQGVVSYHEYIKEINERAETMTMFSSFANPDSFVYRNAVKMPDAYSEMKDTYPVFDRSQGILLATENRFSDILCLFVIITAIMTLMISEREMGLTCLTFSTVKGRKHLAFVKISVLAFIIFIVNLLIFSENLLVANELYGLGDLSRAVQSLKFFTGCILRISVSEYLVIYFSFKTIVFFLTGMLICFISQMANNNIYFYASVCLVTITEVCSYRFIDPMSPVSLIYYESIPNLLNPDSIFSNYKNVNILGYPFQLVSVSFIVIALSVVILSIMTVYKFCSVNGHEYKKIQFRIKKNIRFKIHDRFVFCIYKSLILQKGILVLCVFFLISIFFYSGISRKYDVYDVCYEYYTNAVNGEVTEESINYLKSEEQYYSSLFGQINNLVATESDSIELTKLYEKTIPYAAFTAVKNHADKIYNQQDVCIFYDSGYTRFMGFSGYDDDMKYAFAAMLMCVMLISPLISSDNAVNAGRFIYSSWSGKKRYLLRNTVLASFYAEIASLFWNVSYICGIFSNYGNAGLTAKIQSIEVCEDINLNMSIAEFLLFIILLRTLTIILASWIMLTVSNQCRSMTTAYLINASVFVLPVLVYLMGGEFAVDIGINPFLSVNRIIFNQ